MDKTHSNKLRGWLDACGAMAVRERAWVAFVVALGFTCMIYRLELAAEIYGGSNQPFSLQAKQVPIVAFLQTPLSDLAVVAILALLYFFVKYRMQLQAPRLAANRVFRTAEAVVAALVVLTIALVIRVHCQLLFQLETGLTMTLIEMSPTMMGTRDFFAMFLARDFIFLAAPLTVFLLALGGGRDLRRIYAWAAVAAAVLVLGVQLLPVSRKLSREIMLNPLVYLFGDAMDDGVHAWFDQDSLFRDTADLPGESQRNSIQLVDEAFVTGPKRPPLAKSIRARLASDRPWNIVFFVLESTGSDYVFDQSYGNEVPMPFLQQMVSGGLYLANHHAAANNSAQSAFSIFTGLYPSPTRDIFAMGKSVTIPTLNRYLGDDYHFFLVHPTDASYSFPEAMFRNNGLREFDSKEVLPHGEHPDVNRLARNEVDSFDFFLTRVTGTREPFLAVYWSFAPHFPYDDYGPEYQIVHDLTDKRQLYYNNLRLVDTQLRHVYERLAQLGIAEHTVFVIVGDHGEAFNQHPGVWTHSLGSYSEMYRVPMVFWQPRLISPETVKYPTSHADILPTLLDMVGVPYDESRFQGESVARGEPARKYIFTTDARGQNVAAISKDLKKVAISFDTDWVTAYNLARDPGEKLPLNEARFRRETDALLKFYNYQISLVQRYNEALQIGVPFPRRGHRPAVVLGPEKVEAGPGN